MQTVARYCGRRARFSQNRALPPHAPERPASTSRGTTRAGLRAGAGAAALPMGSRRRLLTVRHLAVTRRRGAGPPRSGTARESTCARQTGVRGRREVVNRRGTAPSGMGRGGYAPPRVARHLHGGSATAGMRPPTAAGAHQRMSNGVKRLQGRGGFPQCAVRGPTRGGRIYGCTAVCGNAVPHSCSAHTMHIMRTTISAGM